jgi:outer membrane protein assembly factor BamA
LFAFGSTLEILRFYGFGNETNALDDRQFYRVDQRQWSITPMLHLPLKAEHLSFDVGATLRYASTDSNAGRYIALARPYGFGTFGQLGARAGFTLDTRDVTTYPTRGVHLSAQGAAYPAVWSTKHAFGDLRTQASTYFTAAQRFQPTLALRVGGDKLWGQYPFFDAAFVGGTSTVRGWRQQRFAGDASLYGNAELRLYLTRFFLLLPGDLGVFGLADAGRVYRAGEQSDSWHPGVGGGLWASFLGRANTMSVSFAHSREGNGVYFRSGLMY